MPGRLVARACRRTTGPSGSDRRCSCPHSTGRSTSGSPPTHASRPSRTPGSSGRNGSYACSTSRSPGQLGVRTPPRCAGSSASTSSFHQTPWGSSTPWAGISGPSNSGLRLVCSGHRSRGLTRLETRSAPRQTSLMAVDIAQSLSTTFGSSSPWSGVLPAGRLSTT
jgi:hypothetical protein